MMMRDTFLYYLKRIFGPFADYYPIRCSMAAFVTQCLHFANDCSTRRRRRCILTVYENSVLIDEIVNSACRMHTTDAEKIFFEKYVYLRALGNYET